MGNYIHTCLALISLVNNMRINELYINKDTRTVAPKRYYYFFFSFFNFTG